MYSPQWNKHINREENHFLFKNKGAATIASAKHEALFGFSV